MAVLAKETSISIGLVLTLAGILVTGFLSVKNDITQNQIALLLINQKLTTIELAVDSRFDTLQSYIDTQTRDMMTEAQFDKWLAVFEAKNQGLNF